MEPESSPELRFASWPMAPQPSAPDLLIPRGGLLIGSSAGPLRINKPHPQGTEIRLKNVPWGAGGD